jgi:hypothetical protein
MKPKFAFDYLALAQFLRAAIDRYQDIQGELIDQGAPDGHAVAREIAVRDTLQSPEAEKAEGWDGR